MSWDRGYYYQHKRINGQPRRVYVGAGLLAELTARMDAQEQAQRVAQDAQRRLQRHKDRATLKKIDAEYQHLRSFVGRLLQAAGYYQHKREWRKMGKKAAQLTGPFDASAPVDIAALVQRINGNNYTAADMDALRRALDAQDGIGLALTVLGDSAMLNYILDQYTNDAAPKLVMQADAQRMAKMLGRDTAPPFEQPLIDHIVVCWLRL
jgi:hypothetical protein